MKILWFTNIPMPDVNSHFNKDVMGTGGWMGALLELLKDIPELQMGVATACSQFPDSRFREDGVDYFIIRQQSSKLRRSIFPVDNCSVYLKKCVEIVNEYKPDIVHIHGTERFYGQMVSKELVDCPVVFSVQGIMDSYSEWYRWFGKISLREILYTSIFDTMKGSGLLWELREARQQAARERKYFKKGRYFFGRTDWDMAYVSYFNPNARYFNVGEVIREPFWKQQWNLAKCKRYRIIFTNTRHPRKGTELLFKAIKKLQALYPDIELVLIGSLGAGEYAKKIKTQIDSFRGAIKSLGQQRADQIARELCRAHLFVSASYIDNSPNSIAEAQIVGMPVVSSYTGGVPSMVQEGKTGLFFPTGDVQLLVSRIKTIFENDFLAINLGKHSMKEARKRHDPDTIVKHQIDAYNFILSENKDNNKRD